MITLVTSLVTPYPTILVVPYDTMHECLVYRYLQIGSVCTLLSAQLLYTFCDLANIE